MLLVFSELKTQDPGPRTQDSKVVGIPDLFIAQNAMQNGKTLYTLDSHFKGMKQCFPPVPGVSWQSIVDNGLEMSHVPNRAIEAT